MRTHFWCDEEDGLDGRFSDDRHDIAKSSQLRSAAVSDDPTGTIGRDSRDEARSSPSPPWT
jgi:hypothetical protein